MLNNRYALTVSLDKKIEENTIYEGYDIIKGRFVWVKFIKPTKYMSDSFISDFIDERTMLDNLDCPYLLRVYDIGNVDVDGTTYIYIVSEYSKGILLTDIIKGKYIHIDGVVNIATQLVKCLSFLHNTNNYHGGLNPSNILVASDYSIKLLEVGITKANKDINIRDNVGKYYLSPIQLSINHTDFETDFYALGTILFEAIFSKLPYDTTFIDDDVELLKSLDKGVYWCTLAPSIIQSNNSLVNIVKRLLDRCDKYSNTEEILLDLSGVLYANANLEVSVVEDDKPRNDLIYLPTSSDKLLGLV